MTRTWQEQFRLECEGAYVATAVRPLKDRLAKACWEGMKGPAASQFCAGSPFESYGWLAIRDSTVPPLNVVLWRGFGLGMPEALEAARKAVIGQAEGDGR